MGRGASIEQETFRLPENEPSSHPSALESPVAWAYLPKSKELLTGRDHHSIVAKQLSAHAGYHPDRVSEIMEGYYSSDEELTSAYWEMFQTAEDWGVANHVLWGWNGFRRYAPSKDVEPQLWSETQGNAATDLAAYGPEALAAAALSSPLCSLLQP